MKIMISAGEVSGDIHGAHLVQELKKLVPQAYFFGLGSEKLLSQGVDIKVDITKRGTIGIFEALPNIIPIFLAYKKMINLMKTEKPDLIILIDSQGINMSLAKAAKKLGIKTVYYIAPQEWLWGTSKGVNKVAKTVDLIVAIFEQEYQTYKKAGANTVYFGHPLIDIVKASPKQKGQNKVVALCPGSRSQEIKNLLPILLQAGATIKAQLPKVEFVIPAASTNMIKKIFNYIGEDFRPKAVVGQTYEILAGADLAICASGTINLEASILGVPNIMTYKLSRLTYFIGKYILRIGDKLKFFSMPNILLGRQAIPELVMEQANPKQICQEAISILTDEERQVAMQKDFSRLKTMLGQGDVISKIAKAILN